MAASAGYFVAMLVAPGSNPPIPEMGTGSARELAEREAGDLIGQPRPDFTLTDLAGEAVPVSRFDGSLLLINFWATWCAPCVEEMPMLSDLQKRYSAQGFEILGIALDDPEKAGDFVAELGIRYPILVGTADAILVGRNYGNRGGMLPYSVLVDPQGMVQWTHLGALDATELETLISTQL